MAYNTKLIKSRFVLSPFTSEQMALIGNELVKSIKTRITDGRDVTDNPAKPLKAATKNYVPYARQKERKGLQPFRDWIFTGRTMRSMKVISASENSGTIGFVDAKADRIAHLNNLQARMFGMSPKNTEDLNTAVHDVLTGKLGVQNKLVTFKRVA